MPLRESMPFSFALYITFSIFDRFLTENGILQFDNLVRLMEFLVKLSTILAFLCEIFCSKSEFLLFTGHAAGDIQFWNSLAFYIKYQFKTSLR